MRRYISLLISLLISFNSFSQNDLPFIKTTGKTINEFIPKGWELIYKAKGDLNKDNLNDEAIIIQNTDTKNLVKNDFLGSDTLNLNPRLLLIIFKNADGYRLISKNSEIIPSENDSLSKCLYDPLGETDGAIFIKNGILTLKHHYWFSCGSWYVTDLDFIFRYQNQKIELIGFNEIRFHRATGEEIITSINFSTRKIHKNTGGNVFGGKNHKPKIKIKNFSRPELIALEKISSADIQKFRSL